MTRFGGKSVPHPYDAGVAKGREESAERIAELETALRDCIEIAASDCEHEACKLVIERAGKLVQLEDRVAGGATR